ncbi:MAG: hypothetical protein HYZ84_06925 [Candidatus Omnitrophica bacterium]|nr:hypothetical protein [Candidatus Omnitrophota bacterium]
MKKNFLIVFLGLLFLLPLAGCGANKSSYPEARLKDALLEICRKEYGIEKIDVKIVGNTIGVYLPLEKLFAADDFKNAVETGKIRNLETLFEPSPEALEKVEDVLFSISRVILSTDKPLDFYVLQATDITKTGLELVLTGYVNDVKRVRVWDISRNEYRKRVIHEMRLNRAVVWHRPVRQFFEDMEVLHPDEIRKKYFRTSPSAEMDTKTYLDHLIGVPMKYWDSTWDILKINSVPLQKDQILIYTKVRPKSLEELLGPKHDLEYLFILELRGEKWNISKIIPFQYVDDHGTPREIDFPHDLPIEKVMQNPEEEFDIAEVKLGPFLAKQLTRRVQGMASADERIQNTFRDIKLEFTYHEDSEKPFFSLDLETILRDFNHYQQNSIALHEDMIYFLNMASREFVTVLRSYSFSDYQYLSLNLVQEPAPHILGRDDLELFRRGKLELISLLSVPKV